MISKKLFLFFVAILVIPSCYLTFKTLFKKSTQKLFTTQQPERRTIKQVIHASGKLEVHDTIKIGSLVGGTMQQILVKENERVQKGQLLAVIDNGKGDTDVKNAQARLERLQAQLEYQKHFFQRQKKLYEIDQISDNDFEKEIRDYHTLQAEVKGAQAQLEKSSIDYNNTRIIAPDDGIVISVGVSKGERITTDLDATKLFDIAKDITKMEGKLEIDESDIGHITVKQIVTFSVDAYLHRTFKGPITRVGYSPTTKKGTSFFKALVDVNNNEKLLRPGMTISAKITVAKTKQALTVTHQMLQIDEELINTVAQKISYEVISVLPAKKKQLKKEVGQYQRAYVWVTKEKQFVQTPIIIDITDDMYFQVVSGLHENDKIVTDVVQKDAMEKMYKKWFGSSL